MTKPSTTESYNRVRARLDEVRPGITDREASKEATNDRNPDLIRKLKSEPVYVPRGENLLGLAELLEVSVDWIVTNIRKSKPSVIEAVDARVVNVKAPRATDANVPVMGTALGSILHSNGQHVFEGFQISQDPIQYARLPEGLAGQRDIYAIFVEGDSMDPMHSPGQIKFVQPHRPPAPGDTVIVQTKHWEHDPGQAYIKVFRRRAGGKIVLEQINPLATLEIPAEYVTAIHRVATDNDLFLF